MKESPRLLDLSFERPRGVSKKEGYVREREREKQYSSDCTSLPRKKTYLVVFLFFSLGWGVEIALLVAGEPA